MKLPLLFFLAFFLNIYQSNAQSQPTHFVAVLLRFSKEKEIVRVIQSDGRLIKGLTKKENTANIRQGDYVLYVMNDQGARLDSVFVKDPLQEWIEYPKENGTMGYLLTPLQNKEVLVRYNYKPGMTTLLIQQLGMDRALTVARLPIKLEP